MIRLLLAASIRTRYFLRRYMPSNILIDLIRTRRGLKWGVPAMLLAIPYLGVAYLLSTAVQNRVPGWLNLFVFVAIWSALKMLYARSAGSSEQQVKRQRKLCRSYLREVGLTEVGFVAEYGHPGPGLSEVVSTAARNVATEVVVCDLSRLGRTPLVNLKNSAALEEAGLTIHVAAGIVSGPVTDDDIRDKMLLFAETDLRTLYGDDLAEQ